MARLPESVVGALRRKTTMEFMEALPPVVDRIMSLFALAIGFPEDFFKTVRCPCPACPSTQQPLAGP